VTRDVVSLTYGHFAVTDRPWASCFHACSSVVKRCNLVLAAGHRCPAVGKVTVGLALHWPCVRDSSGLIHVQAEGVR